MESNTTKLTSTSRKHGNLNIRPCGKDSCPEDIATIMSKVATSSEKHTHKTVQLRGQHYGKQLDIGYVRTCNCPKTHINCLTPKEWLKCQLGVWQFTYEGRDVRDKNVHPATFPDFVGTQRNRNVCL